MRIILRSVVPAICILTIAAATLVPDSLARKTQQRYADAIPSRTPTTLISLDRVDPDAQPLRATAAPDTTWLGYWTFDAGGAACTDEGWVSVDNHAREIYTHVDDFAGLGGGSFGRLFAPEGSQALWCGVRPDPNDYELCGYAALPGYGNNWFQTFTTSNCLNVTGDVVVDFLMNWDSEPGYDHTCVQFDQCDDNWITRNASSAQYYFTCIDGWDSDHLEVDVPDSLHSSNIRLRFLFTSDGAWSDQDGNWNTDGAYIVDSLTVTDASGIVLPTELFEAESVGATTTVSGNWEAGTLDGYGDFAALYSGIELVQEDLCVSNLTCMWAFINGSAFDYACGGYPAQATVSYENDEGLSIDNEIQSPWMPVIGTGSTFEVGFDVYADLPQSALVFYLWHVRSLVDGCPERWQDRNFVFLGEDKEWRTHIESVGDLVSPLATHLQLGLGVIDMCFVWCGSFGNGECHSHAPLFDNAFIRRIDTNGPAWATRDIELFQDNFSTDGTTTGTVRIDMAIDKLPTGATNIRPGDSATVYVADLENGLAIDPHTGFGPAAYMYVGIWPQGQPGKSGSALSSDPFRWPVVDSLTYAGNTWYCVRMDSVFFWPGRDNPRPDQFCVDLNDDLFTPGDTICYFFGAQSDGPATLTTYYSSFTGTTDDIGHALANPMEVSCLPTTSPLSGRRILYVDNHDGQGAQPFFDTAFDILALNGQVDRYDILGATNTLDNGPASRIADPMVQLVSAYHTIIWNSGDQPSKTLRDGSSGAVSKVDDAALLYAFLDNLPVPGGVYLSGDNLASDWVTLTNSGAINLRSVYMNFDVADNDHANFGLGASPLVVGLANGCFDHVTGPDSLIGFGGCPEIHRFDVLQPTGSSAAEAAYIGGGTAGVAVLAQKTTNPQTADVGVVLSGFSFDAIRDIDATGMPARVEHLNDIITWLGNIAPVPTPVGPNAYATSLSQNYPNPFNPTTAIEFTLRERAPVTLRVYNVRGQLIRTLVNEERPSGIVHHVEWNGRNDAGQSVASGVYFYRLVTTDYVSTRKMVLLK